jgi:hypothetical protein
MPTEAYSSHTALSFLVPKDGVEGNEKFNKFLTDWALKYGYRGDVVDEMHGFLECTNLERVFLQGHSLEGVKFSTEDGRSKDSKEVSLPTH